MSKNGKVAGAGCASGCGARKRVRAHTTCPQFANAFAVCTHTPVRTREHACYCACVRSVRA
eukprot:495842-Pleurochrysis_carterae.AAC.1